VNHGACYMIWVDVCSPVFWWVGLGAALGLAWVGASEWWHERRK
jgi:hypothetical protein